MRANRRVLYMRKIFRKYTDDRNFITMPEIKKYIRAYGFDVGERAILSDIDALIFYGMDIEYVHNKGYHLKSRPFSLSILKMLADAIASFRLDRKSVV